MGDLVDMITDAFATEKKNDKIDEYLNCELLVIDDAFDKAKVTLFKSGYQLPYLDRFIRKRLETYKLNTIFTSNVKIEEIQDNGFSYDIQNLIERNIKLRGGYLEFNDVFVSDEYNIDVKSIWD
jgi:DNA replication protein DnaC